MIGWPLDLNYIRGGSLNNTFGMVRRKANGTKKPHQGWDLHALIGTPCYAVADGKVEAIRNSGDYGIVLVLKFRDEGKTWYAAYCHLSSTTVNEGDAVLRGLKIGKTGDTGNAKGMGPEDQHLHFEIREVPWPGLGLTGRVSPVKLLGVCPIHQAVKRD